MQKNLFYQLILTLLAFNLSCSNSDDDDDDTAETVTIGGTFGEITDTTQDGITEFLETGEYRDWTAEGAIHSSPTHGTVRTFFNDTLLASLAAVPAAYPKESIAVKEIYEDDEETLKGWTVEIKVGSGTSGNDWLWYEGFTPNYDEFYGVGLSACVSCHSSGTDYVRSEP